MHETVPRRLKPGKSFGADRRGFQLRPFKTRSNVRRLPAILPRQGAFCYAVAQMRSLYTILLVLGCASLFAQEKPISVTEMQSSGLQGSIADFKRMPPDITLIPHGQGARNGHLWIRNGGYYLLIAGEVDGDPPDFPKNQN